MHIYMVVALEQCLFNLPLFTWNRQAAFESKWAYLSVMCILHQNCNISKMLYYINHIFQCHLCLFFLFLEILVLCYVKYMSATFCSWSGLLHTCPYCLSNLFTFRLVKSRRMSIYKVPRFSLRREHQSVSPK